MAHVYDDDRIRIEGEGFEVHPVVLALRLDGYQDEPGLQPPDGHHTAMGLQMLLQPLMCGPQTLYGERRGRSEMRAETRVEAVEDDALQRHHRHGRRGGRLRLRHFRLRGDRLGGVTVLFCMIGKAKAMHARALM